MPEHFRILSIDGGGFRGLYPAHILACIEKAWCLDWRERFGLFAGTSTGAILAAGLAADVPASKLRDFYLAHGREIFRKRPLAVLDPKRLFASHYSGRRLRSLLDEVFGERTLGEVEVPLILPAVDIGNGSVHLFKSSYHGEFKRDQHVRVADAVLASCSAPLYFDPHIVGAYELADGGLWANNPTLVAVIDAHRRLAQPLDTLRVFSLGTGHQRTFYPREPTRLPTRLWRALTGWGFLTRWKTTRFIELILDLQSTSAHNTVCLLLGEDPKSDNYGRVFRLNFETDLRLSLDNPRQHHDLLARADKDFTYHCANIRSFLSLERNPENA